MSTTPAVEPNAAGSSDANPRKTQRAPKSCTSCAKLKKACNKELPCNQCIKRGHPHLCSRETVMVNGKLVEGERASPDCMPSVEELLKINTQLRRRLARYERRATQTPGKELSPGTIEASPLSLLAAASEPSTSAVKLESQDDELMDDEALGELAEEDYSTMGVRRPAKHDAGRDDDSDDIDDNPRPTKRIRTSDLGELFNLIPLRLSHLLVAKSLELTGFTHGVVHAPAYLQKHQLWHSRLLSGNIHIKNQALALYFALISAALYFVDDEVATGPWGLSYEEKETLPRTWFDASVDALYRSDFLAVPRVESVQTICVLTLCGHNFGATTLLTNLLHIGIKLAVSLGYDKLLPETPTSPNAGRVQRELGRRMWACLYVGEALSPVATQPDALFTECARTAQPANIDDENLTDERAFESKPMSTTTYMTHLICVWRLAHRHRLFCRAFQSATSVKARFQAVKEYSRQLDHVFDDTELGPTSVVATPAHPQSFDYRPWSRRILKDGVERQQINAWRLFLRRAYVDADYAEARQACLTLARSILAEASKASPRMYEKAWPQTNAQLGAAFILAYEYSHATLSDEDKAALQSEIAVHLARIELSKVGNVGQALRVLRKMTALSATTLQSTSPSAPISFEGLGENLGDLMMTHFFSATNTWTPFQPGQQPGIYANHSPSSLFAADPYSTLEF